MDKIFRFYPPVHLIADLRGQLDSANPVFHLTWKRDAHESERPRIDQARKYYRCNTELIINSVDIIAI